MNKYQDTIEIPSRVEFADKNFLVGNQQSSFSAERISAGIPNTTGETTPAGFPNTTGETTLDYLTGKSQVINQLLLTLKLFSKISDRTGGSVKFLEEYGFFPVLIGDNNKPILLHTFIEVIDEIIDYDNLLEEFPTLSISKINSAVSFIKKLSSINMFNVDIDDIEDSFDLADKELLKAMHEVTSKQGQGKRRVLYHDK